MNNHGFSVVELMVSLAIVAMIGTTIIINQSQFNRSVQLNNHAHEIALTFRSWQSEALNVVRQDEEYQRGSGIVIQGFNPISNSGEMIRFFNDDTLINGDNGFDGRYSAGDNFSNSINFSNSKFDLVQLCAQFEDLSETCFPSTLYQNQGAVIQEYSFSFARPFADPIMYLRYGNNEVKANVRNESKEIDRLIIGVGDAEQNSIIYIVINAGGRIYTTKNYPEL